MNHICYIYIYIYISNEGNREVHLPAVQRSTRPNLQVLLESVSASQTDRQQLNQDSLCTALSLSLSLFSSLPSTHLFIICQQTNAFHQNKIKQVVVVVIEVVLSESSLATRKRTRACVLWGMVRCYTQSLADFHLHERP